VCSLRWDYCYFFNFMDFVSRKALIGVMVDHRHCAISAVSFKRYTKKIQIRKHKTLQTYKYNQLLDPKPYLHYIKCTLVSIDFSIFITTVTTRLIFGVNRFESYSGCRISFLSVFVISRSLKANFRIASWKNVPSASSLPNDFHNHNSRKVKFPSEGLGL
jgi:hypothetical protein